jgi:DnaJ like chaperone protein
MFDFTKFFTFAIFICKQIMIGFLGFIFGWIFSKSFWGGVLGGLIGQLVDKMISHKTTAGVYGNKHYYSQENFIQILLVFTAAVMNADGQPKVSELNYVKNYLRKNFSEEKLRILLLKLRDILQNEHFEVQTLSEELRQKASVHERLYVIQFLLGLALSDGRLTAAELALIQQISDSMGINRNDFESIKTMYLLMNGGHAYAGNYYTGSYENYSGNTSAQSFSNIENDYKILEITSSATDEEVKIAYRNLAKKYHPDKVSHLGEEIRKDAEEKFKCLHQAYERIKKYRGMK